jgi:uncharacterized RDD family membrane protein YckC
MSTGTALQSGLEKPATRRVEFVGFWRRVAAFAIDSALLGCVGAVVGTALDNWLVVIGQWGRLIGFVIAGVYFILATGRQFGGQTLGKRLLGIRVQSTSGDLLSLRRSAIRYLIFAIPYFCNGLYIHLNIASHVVEVISEGVLGAILVIGILGNAYLLLFNRPGRRLLHDIAARSVVVKEVSPHAPEFAPLAVRHLWVFATIVVVIAIGGYWLVKRVGNNTGMKALERAQIAVAHLPDVVAAGVNDSTFTVNGRSSHALTINTRVVTWPQDKAAAATKLVLAATDNCSTETDFDSIRVVFIRGFDIGIAQTNRQELLVKSPREWCVEAGRTLPN